MKLFSIVYSAKLVVFYFWKIHFALRFNAIFLGCLLFSNSIHSQSITPFVFNNGGGYSSNLLWSIGESTSISSFTNPNGFSLNTGFLHPQANLITSINENENFLLSNQVALGPIPTANLLHINAQFNELGSLQLQLIDANSNIILSKEIKNIFNNYDGEILLKDYPPGLFYLKMNFKSSVGISKIGLYKIIKI